MNRTDRAFPWKLIPVLLLARSVAVAVLVCVSACRLWQGAPEQLAGTDTRVTFLHTTDIHSRLFPYQVVPSSTDEGLGLHEDNAPYGGAARLAYLLRRERARADRVLHLDSGDPFQGAPVFNQNLGEPEVRFLSAVGLDGMVVGNHDFDTGVDNYAYQLQLWAGFSTLAANYVFPDLNNPQHHPLGDLVQPFTVYNLRGLKIAVIGMANIGSLSSIGEGGNSLQITPHEQNEALRAYVRLLHGTVDLIVVLSHLGLDEDQDLVRGYETVVWKDRLPASWPMIADLGDGRVRAWVPGVSHIDLILGGHLHVVLNPPMQVEDPLGRTVLIVHSGAFAKFLGRLDVVAADDEQFGGKRIVSHKYQVLPVDDRLAGHEDPEVVELLAPFAIDLSRNLDLQRVIAYAPHSLLRRSLGRGGDSGLGNLVAESMRVRRRVNAELAITNTLGIRDNFYRGPITLEDLFNVFPFENTLTVMHLSGSEIQDLVDFVTERSAERGCQSQAQVAGLSFTMNCGQVLLNRRDPARYEHPGEAIAVNGEPLNPAATYRVATNDYIAKGGSGFLVLKRNTTKMDTGVSLRDGLIDYLATRPRCGDYERTRGRFCEQQDEVSLAMCREIGDADRVQRAWGSDQGMGVYANTPCVLGEEDQRIQRLTSDSLESPGGSDTSYGEP